MHVGIFIAHWLTITCHHPSLSELSLSYNGGKDCLVLLILFLSTLANHPLLPSLPQNTHSPVQSVYIQASRPFPAVESFVARTTTTYSLALARYPVPMKAAFAAYLRDAPGVRAIFVGTRRTDPHGAALQPFQRTDHGWPDFERVHPVLEWRYADIWAVSRGVEGVLEGLWADVVG